MLGTLGRSLTRIGTTVARGLETRGAGSAVFHFSAAHNPLASKLPSFSYREVGSRTVPSSTVFGGSSSARGLHDCVKPIAGITVQIQSEVAIDNVLTALGFDSESAAPYVATPHESPFDKAREQEALIRTQLSNRAAQNRDYTGIDERFIPELMELAVWQRFQDQAPLWHSVLGISAPHNERGVAEIAFNKTLSLVDTSAMLLFFAARGMTPSIQYLLSHHDQRFKGEASRLALAAARKNGHEQIVQNALDMPKTGA